MTLRRLRERESWDSWWLDQRARICQLRKAPVIGRRAVECRHLCAHQPQVYGHLSTVMHPVIVLERPAALGFSFELGQQPIDQFRRRIQVILPCLHFGR